MEDPPQHGSGSGSGSGSGVEDPEEEELQILDGMPTGFRQPAPKRRKNPSRVLPPRATTSRITTSGVAPSIFTTSWITTSGAAPSGSRAPSSPSPAGIGISIHAHISPPVPNWAIRGASEEGRLRVFRTERVRDTPPVPNSTIRAGPREGAEGGLHPVHQRQEEGEESQRRRLSLQEMDRENGELHRAYASLWARVEAVGQAMHMHGASPGLWDLLTASELTARQTTTQLPAWEVPKPPADMHCCICCAQHFGEALPDGERDWASHLLADPSYSGPTLSLRCSRMRVAYSCACGPNNGRVDLCISCAGRLEAARARPGGGNGLFKCPYCQQAAGHPAVLLQ